MNNQYQDGENLFDIDHQYRGPGYTEEHETWRKSLRKFIAREIMPFVEQWEEAGEVPRELYQKAAAVGFMGLGMPEELGGQPVDDIYYAMTVGDELARTGAGGIATSLLNHTAAIPAIVAYGSEELKQRIVPPTLAGDWIHGIALTEPNGGSDLANLETRADRDGDHYVVTGSKTYITCGMRGDSFSVAVRTGGEGARGISLLVIESEREGFSRTPLKKQGWLCSDTATLYFDQVRVPVGNLIGEENQGFKYLVMNLNRERLNLAAGMNATSRICMSDALAWARQRSTFGKRLCDHQVIRHKFAEMARQINATQAYIDQVATRLQAGEEPAADTALMKVQASLTMEFVAREAMQIMGGAGYMRGSRIERIYREVRVNAIGGGSEEILRDLAARQMGV